MFTKRKQIKYQTIIKDLLVLPDTEEKISMLQEALTKYYEFCSKNGLNKDLPFDNKLHEIFIIASNPDMPSEFPNIELIADDLREALKINKEEGLVTGLTMNEAETLLSYSITNARNILCNDRDITTYSLEGECGHAQFLTLYPFYDLGCVVTINNVMDFPETSKHGHAFGTVTFPIINENGIVSNTTFLVDATYRQFFTVYGCHKGRYYLNTGPEAGYFTVQSKEGKDFAKNLLKKGFVPLNLETIKLYGEGFRLSLIKNITQINEAKKILPEDYMASLTTRVGEFDYNSEAIVEMLAEDNILFPTKGLDK